MSSRFRQVLYYGLPFIGDFNNSMLTIVFILFGVQIGLEPSQIGLIVTVYGFSYLLSSPLIGLLGDKVSRKSSIVIATTGQTIISLIYVLYFHFSSFNHYLIFILIGQSFRAIIYAFYWPAIEAYLSEISGNSVKKHQKNIGFFCIAWSLGAAVGSNLGGFFTEHNPEWALLLVLIMYTLGIFITLFTMDSQKRKIRNSKNDDTIIENKPDHGISEENPLQNNDIEGEINSRLSSKVLTQISIILLGGTLFFAMACNGIMNYFPNFAKIPEGFNFTEGRIGWFVFIFGIARFLAFLLQEKIPINIPFMILSMGILSITIIFFGITPNLVLLGIILTISGFFAGRLYYNALELTLKYEHKAKGAKAGIFESIVGMGSGIAPVISGFLAEINLQYPFYVFGLIGIVITGIGLFIYLKIKNNLRKSK